jgi:hypothetical protein
MVTVDDGPVDSAEAPPGRGRATPGHRGLAPIAVIVGAFAASRVAFWLAGVRFDTTAVTSNSEQVLAVRLLQHHLVTSVWHLDDQPPLFNLYAGILLHLPHGAFRPVAWLSYMAIGLVLVLATYLLLLELRVAPVLALVVALVLIVDPAQILYENWFFYAYPSAALVTLSALLFARYVRTRSWGYGLGFFGAVSALALLDSSFQAVWVLAVVVLTVVVCRDRIRQVLAVAALPVLVFGGWVVKDYVMFGTVTTSSWVGMNLADVTLRPAAHDGQIAAMVHRGQLTPVALIGPWKDVAAYAPRYVAVPHTGVAALDDPYSNGTFSNFNNLVYVKVSSLLLHDDLRYIADDPGAYAHNVALGATVWLTPSDQYPFVYDNWTKIRPLADGFDLVLGWQAHPSPGATTAFGALDGRFPAPGQIAFSTVLVYAVGLLGAPLFLLLRRRRLDRASVGIVVLLWGTTAYAYAASSLLDLSENNRFRFEIGTVPLVLALVVVLWSVEPLLTGRQREGRWWRWLGLTGPPAPE